MSDLFAYAERATSYPQGVPKDVCDLFEKLAMDIKKQGWGRYSADAILHRVRWHMHIERGLREFKCNNNWTSVLARWFLDRHPDMQKFFETRERRGEL